ARTPQPPQPGQVLVLEHAGADGGAGGGEKGLRYLLPWAPEGEPHAFIPRTVPVDEYLDGDGGQDR
ncbi:hypothetical protein, partial [Streptomyces sp. GSL17-113]|uniref:hypothetical protein n=1 Tax=Streptomyces sp. GSL17-113 TaxID=3115365 RepID=UPI002E79129F